MPQTPAPGQSRNEAFRAFRWGLFGCLGVFAGFCVVVVLAAVIGSMGSSGNGSTVTVQPGDLTPSHSITLSQFKRVQAGMTYHQVAAILGSQGTVMSQVDIGGMNSVMYEWDAGFLASITASFQNGKLVSKAQIGLQ